MDEVCGNEGLEDLLPTSRSAGVTGLRKPCRAVGVEVPQDESIILRGQEILKGGGEIRGAGGGGGDVDIEDPEWGMVDDGCDGEMFCGCVQGEK